MEALIQNEARNVQQLMYSDQQIDQLRLIHSTMLEKDIWLDNISFRLVV